MRRASAIPDGLQLLRVPEVARLLAVSPRTVASLMASGELPSVTVRRCRRIRRADLAGYLNRQTEGEALRLAPAAPREPPAPVNEEPPLASADGEDTPF